MAKQEDAIQSALAALIGPLRGALVAAYEAGRAEGDQQSRTEMTHAVQKVMNHAFGELLAGRISADAIVSKTIPEAVIETKAPNGSSETERARITRGSAKPAVLARLRRMPAGVTARNLYQLMRSSTGIKENTVRGTLNKLRIDGDAAKKGNLWFARA